MLSQGEGIEEVLVFSTCNRTEFVVWGDATLAVNSVLRFLTAEYDLKLCEWNSFYRLLDEQALAHAFRVNCGLDSMCIGEEQIGRQVSSAWRVRKETALGSHCPSASCAAVALAEQIFGSLAERNVVLLGAGKMGESASKALASRGAHSVSVVNRTDARAEELAHKRGIRACRFEDRWTSLAQADLVVSATTAAGFVFTAEELKPLASDRKGRKLVLIDLALPRDIDPAVREFEGVLLYDLEDLERAVEPRAGARPGEREAEQIVVAEVQGFRQELMADHAAPVLTALRLRLNEICRQELKSFRLEQGPFPKDQDQLIAAVGARITHKIAGSLARELKGRPETKGQKRMRVIA